MSNENDFGDFDFVEQYGTTEEVVNEELLPEFMPGDVNYDWQVNVTDVIQVVDLILEGIE